MVIATLGLALPVLAAEDPLPPGVRLVPGKGYCRERPAEGSEMTPVTRVGALPPGPGPVSAPRPKPKPRPKGVIEGKITINGESNANHVVVYVQGAPAARPQPVKNKPQVFQRDLAFVPDVTVVTVGSTVEFPNQDRVFHNIFSVSEPSKFDLGLYKSGESRSVTFTKPGTIDVYCNIHPQMISKIKVLDTKYFAMTGNDGSFRIEGVPEGKYKLVAWHSLTDETAADVTVVGNQTANANVALTLGRKKATHLRKDGTPYERYK